MAQTRGKKRSSSFSLDAQKAEIGVDPYVLDLGDREIVIDGPTTEQMKDYLDRVSRVQQVLQRDEKLDDEDQDWMEDEKSNLLNLLCQDKYDEVWAVFKGESPRLFQRFTEELQEYFFGSLGNSSAPGR